MNYYEDTYCHVCGQQVCQYCGCCQNEYCEYCSCPEVERNTESENNMIE